MQRKVLVTGGAGFIGSHCIDALLAEGASVTVFDIKPQVQAHNVAHAADALVYVEGDVRDARAVAYAAVHHTHILHLAAVVSVPASIADPVGTHEVNVTGALNVFEAARQCGVSRVVYASSAAVYGDATMVPTPETAPTEPLSPYGAHKLMNELYAHVYAAQYEVSAVGLRFFNVFGSRQDAHSPYSGVISVFADRLLKGESPMIHGDGSATRDFVHVSDVVQACTRALWSAEASSGVYNVGTGNAVSIAEVFRSMQAQCGSAVAAEYTSARPGDILHSCADIARIIHELGYCPRTSLSDGLAEMFSL